MAQPIDGRAVNVTVVDGKLEATTRVLLSRRLLSVGDGCELAAVTRYKCALDKFRQLPPPSHQPQSAASDRRSGVFNVLHAAETWTMTVVTLNHPRPNDHAVIRWSVMEVSSDSLLSKLGIQDLDVVLCTSGIRWIGRV